MSNNEILACVVDRIKKIRINSGVSQMELCLRANLSQSFLANIESGKKQPSLLPIIRIANALEVSPKIFFPDIKERSKDDIKKEIMELVQLL